MYFTPDDPVFQTVRDFTLDDTRHFLGDKIKKFQDLADNLAKTNDRDLLAKAAKEKKYIKKYKEHLTLAMHVQQNLMKPVNFKLFEYEQVRLKNFENNLRKQCIANEAPGKEIIGTLEEMIAFNAPIEKVYKMLIILSNSEGSLKQAYFE